MHRTDATDFAADIGNGEQGFKETPPNNETVMSANFANAIQEEIAFVITEAGLTLRAGGAADAAAQWQQLQPAILIHIENAVDALAASDINNDSTVTGASVKEALETVDAIAVAANDAITAHLAGVTDVHLASAIDNNSIVNHANVAGALNVLQVGVNENIDSIGVNANSIGANATQIALNSNAIAAISIKGVIRSLGQTGIDWTTNLDPNASLYSANFAMPGVTVGDTVIVTPLK